MNPMEQRKRPQISLELLVRKGNHQWTSHGCYSPQEKQLAMDEARKLDKDPQFLAVKLVKETYDPEDNASSEITLFASAGLTTSRWSQGFEHRKAEKKSEKSDGAAKQAANGKTAAAPKARQGVFAALVALVKSMFTVEIESRPQAAKIATPAVEQRKDKETKPARAAQDLEPRLQKALEAIMKFIADAIAVLDQTSLDQYDRFGIALYIGGASNLLCRKEKLSTEDAATILSTALFAIGLSKERAEDFAEEYESYLLENARNLHMFQAGRDAMIAYRADGVTSEHTLVAALRAWNEQKLAPEHDKRRPLTLMFTDIVESSAIAEQQGNDFAAKLLRVHNMIVKSAISHYGGRYVKHTGDGILAAYDDAQMAVKSAAVIQRCVHQHNGEFPHLPLHLRIGLNGGDTVAEGEDVFGSSVNLASRVCALAGADQVFCTGIVRNRAKGGKIEFADRGEHDVKGFTDPIPVYEALWGDHATAEDSAADPAAAEAREPAAAAE